jgi:hypothetical protein
MGQIIVRTCDYDGCDQREEIVTNHELRVIDGWRNLPVEVIGDILWRNYDPDAFPDGRYLCPDHDRQIRTERGIRLRGAMR